MRDIVPPPTRLIVFPSLGSVTSDKGHVRLDAEDYARVVRVRIQRKENTLVGLLAQPASLE